MTQPGGSHKWFEVAEVAMLASPTLLVYQERVRENVRRMIALAGGVARLRPHLKTHKMPEVIAHQLSLGITRFKCATIAEAEMAARCGVPDLLLAYPPVGPNVHRLVELVRAFPQTHFSAIVDDPEAIRAMSGATGCMRAERGGASGCDAGLEILLDIDVGQHRTGVPAGTGAVELYRLIAALPGLNPGGLHAYDGHICDADIAARTQACEAAFLPVAGLRHELLQAGLPVPRIVAGGTPTFPIHARRDGVECSPGTCVFWDASYTAKLPDLDFLPAALVLSRVVSKPGAHLLCLDLGHKAIASEMPHPRVQFLNAPEARAVAHSEEHLVIQTARAPTFRVGDCLYGLPWHICPTVALYPEAVVIEGGKISARWKVTARERRLTI